MSKIRNLGRRRRGGFSTRTAACVRFLLKRLEHFGIAAVAGSAGLSLHGFDIGRPFGDIDVAVFGDATPAAVADMLKMIGDVKVEHLRGVHLQGGHLEARLPIAFRGLMFDLLFPVQMASRASCFRREPAERLVEETLASVTMIDGMPVIGATQVLAWKILMCAGDSAGKHLADFQNIGRQTATISIDDAAVLRHIEANAGPHSTQYNQAVTLLFPSKSWWSSY